MQTGFVKLTNITHTTDLDEQLTITVSVMYYAAWLSVQRVNVSTQCLNVGLNTTIQTTHSICLV